MAITRTAKGVSHHKTAVSTWNALAGVAVCANAALIVGIAHNPASGALVTWNGTALTKAVSAVNVGNVEGSLWALLSNPTSGTGTIAVSWPSVNVTAKTLVAAQVNGVNTLDKTTTGVSAGVVTVVSTGSTTTTSGVTYLAALAGIEGVSTNAAGVWQVDADQAGQRDATSGGAVTTNITIFEGFALSLTSGTRSARLSGMTANNAVGLLATFQQVDHFTVASALAVPMTQIAPRVTNTVGAITLLPGLLAVPVTLPVPGVTTGVAETILLPSLLAIPMGGHAPRVLAATSVIPALLPVSIRSQTPEMTPGAVAILPARLGVPVTQPLPVVQATTSVMPALLQIPVSQHAPGVTTGAVDIKPALQAVPITPRAPTVLAETSVVPAILRVPITLHAPLAQATITLRVSTPQRVPALTLVPTATNLGATTLIVSALRVPVGLPPLRLEATTTLLPGALRIPVTLPARAIQAAASVIPALLPVPGVLHSPTVVAINTILPSDLHVGLSVHTGTLQAMASVLPALLTVPLDLPLPGVQATTTLLVTPPQAVPLRLGVPGVTTTTGMTVLPAALRIPLMPLAPRMVPGAHDVSVLLMPVPVGVGMPVVTQTTGTVLLPTRLAVPSRLMTPVMISVNVPVAIFSTHEIVTIRRATVTTAEISRAVVTVFEV